MHGTQLGPGYKTPEHALGPNTGLTPTSPTSTTVGRATRVADDPRTKSYQEG